MCLILTDSAHRCWFVGIQNNNLSKKCTADEGKYWRQVPGDDVIFNLAKCSSAIKLTVMYGVEGCVSEFGAHALPSRADTSWNVRDITPAA